MKKMKYLIILSVVLISCKKSKFCTETTIDTETNKEVSKTTYYATPQRARQLNGTVEKTTIKLASDLTLANGDTIYIEKTLYKTTIKCN